MQVEYERAYENNRENRRQPFDGFDGVTENIAVELKVSSKHLSKVY